MSKITDIINKYTAGEATLEETNATLAELGADLHLEPRLTPPLPPTAMACWIPAPVPWIRFWSRTVIWWTATAARCTPCA